jgi:hypothetical protein
MGYRTLVMFNNDTVHQIKDIPNFGDKLHHLILQGKRPRDTFGMSNIAWVVGQDHADVQRLAYIDNFQVKSLATSNWHPDQVEQEQVLNLLKDAADKLGYRLVRKSK